MGMDENFGKSTPAILSSALYGIGIPVLSLLLPKVGTLMTSSLLLLGMGVGLLLLSVAERMLGRVEVPNPLVKGELKFMLLMVLADASNIMLLVKALESLDPFRFALLLGFFPCFNALFSAVIFHYPYNLKSIIALLLFAISSFALGFFHDGRLVFDWGAVCMLCASFCFALRCISVTMLPYKSTRQLGVLRGCFAGIVCFLIALAMREDPPRMFWGYCVFLLGFIVLGLPLALIQYSEESIGMERLRLCLVFVPFWGIAASSLIFLRLPDAESAVTLLFFLWAWILLAFACRGRK